MAAVEKAVLAAQIEFEAPLRAVFGVAHGHEVVAAVVGVAAVKRRIVEAVGEACRAVVDNALRAQDFFDVFVFVVGLAYVGEVAEIRQRAVEAFFVVRLPCGEAFGAVFLEGGVVKLVLQIVGLARFIILRDLIAVLFQFFQGFVFGLEGDDFAFFGEEALGGRAGEAGGVFVFDEELADFGVGFAAGAGGFGFELPAIVEDVFEGGEDVVFVGLHARPVRAQPGAARQGNGAVAGGVGAERGDFLVLAGQDHAREIGHFPAFLIQAAEGEHAAVADVVFQYAVDDVFFAHTRSLNDFLWSHAPTRRPRRFFSALRLPDTSSISRRLPR